MLQKAHSCPEAAGDHSSCRNRGATHPLFWQSRCRSWCPPECHQSRSRRSCCRPAPWGWPCRDVDERGQQEGVGLSSWSGWAALLPCALGSLGRSIHMARKHVRTISSLYSREDRRARMAGGKETHARQSHKSHTQSAHLYSRLGGCSVQPSSSVVGCKARGRGKRQVRGVGEQRERGAG